MAKGFGVSIPRRVLRGFRDDFPDWVPNDEDVGFNTPEGVEGFSRLAPTAPNPGAPNRGRFNTPEGVEGFSSSRASLNVSVTVPWFQYPGGC